MASLQVVHHWGDTQWGVVPYFPLNESLDFRGSEEQLSLVEICVVVVHTLRAAFLREIINHPLAGDAERPVPLLAR